MIIYYSLLANDIYYVRWTRPLRVLFPFALQTGQNVRIEQKIYFLMICFLLSLRFVESFEIFFEHYRILPMLCSYFFFPYLRLLFSALDYFEISKFSNCSYDYYKYTNRLFFKKYSISKQ